MHGRSGSLEFILNYPTEKYGKKISKVYDTEWKYPIAMSLIARPNILIIRFKHGTRGCAEAKINIGPSETIWSDLVEGGCKNCMIFFLFLFFFLKKKTFTFERIIF